MIARLEKLAPLAGGLAGLLWLVGILLLQSRNPADPQAADLTTYFREERTPILVGGLLVALGVFLFFWFLASLSQQLDGWLAAAASIGGTAGGAMMAALTGPHTTGATTDAELLAPQTSVAFWRLSHTYFIAAEVAFAVFVAAVALSAFTTGVVPRWLAWASLALALILLVQPIAWLGLILLLPAWLIGAGIALWRRSRATRAPA